MSERGPEKLAKEKKCEPISRLFFPSSLQDPSGSRFSINCGHKKGGARTLSATNINKKKVSAISGDGFRMTPTTRVRPKERKYFRLIKSLLEQFSCSVALIGKKRPPCHATPPRKRATCPRQVHQSQPGGSPVKTRSFVNDRARPFVAAFAGMVELLWERKLGLS